MKDDKFNFWMPCEIEKAKDSKGKVKMRVKGVASTPDKDADDEELMPIGFELDRFVTSGQINWNHMGKKDPYYIIGEPDVARVTSRGELYIEGDLYEDSKLAKSVWDFAQTLEKNSSKRRLGFSIEGKALERDVMNPKKITKALITGVAITPTPVNASTYMDLCKGVQDDDYIDYEYDDDSISAMKKIGYISTFKACGFEWGITKSFTVERISKSIDKKKTKFKKVMDEFGRGELKSSSGEIVQDQTQALAIAYSESGLDKSLDIEKEMGIAETAPLVPESLDNKTKTLDMNVKRAIIKGFLKPDKVFKILNT